MEESIENIVVVLPVRCEEVTGALDLELSGRNYAILAEC